MTSDRSLENSVDLQIVHGAIHDRAGPVSSLVPLTQPARDWLTSVMGADLSETGGALIETDNTGLVIDCAERDGLTLQIIGRAS